MQKKNKKIIERHRIYGTKMCPRLLALYSQFYSCKFLGNKCVHVALTTIGPN